MRKYWEENLHEFNRYGLVKRVAEIANIFDRLVPPRDYGRPRLYYIAQSDFNYLKIGSSKNPHKRMVDLQTGNPIGLVLVFFTDIEKELRSLHELGGPHFSREWTTIQSAETHERDWVQGARDLSEQDAEGEWVAFSERAFRIIIRQGRIVLENLAEALGINYSDL